MVFMLKLIFKSSKKKLDLPLYSLTEKKSRVKSTFIDENRPDTVKPRIVDLTNIPGEETKSKQLTKKINNSGN